MSDISTRKRLFMETVTPKLMVVENDPYFIYLLRLYAEQSGFAVVCTNSGLGALALAEQERPSVIVLESELPEINGWEILRSLRTRPLTYTIPVVMCLWQDSKQECNASPSEGFLHKPMGYEDFVVALKDVGVWPANNPERPLPTPEAPAD
jgi:CheY-like chemotaxis protein